MHHKNKAVEYAKIFFIKIGKFMRDYDKEPIVVKNDYLRKMELTTVVGIYAFGLFILSYGLIWGNFGYNYHRYIVISCGCIIIVANSKSIKNLLILFKNRYLITIYNDKIVFDFVDENGNLKHDIIDKKDIIKVSWSFMPFCVGNDNIWLYDDTKNISEKLFGVILMPLSLILSLLHYFLFFMLSGFKFRKYILYRFKGWIIFIPNNEKIDTKNIKFEILSLFNRHILQGGDYDKK